MANNLTVLQHEGRNQEQFLAIESAAGIVGKATEEITVPEGAAFISVFLTNPTAEGFRRVADVSAKLISPANTTYGESEILPAKGQDADSVEMSTTHEIGQMIYLARPPAGKWTVELDAKASTPFSCEIRVLPEISAPAPSNQAVDQSLVDFGKNLPKTMITNRLYEELGQQEGIASSPPDCMTCQTTISVALVAFGLVALVVAAIFTAFFPPAAAVATALALIGVTLAIDFIIGFFMNLVAAILDNPSRAVTLFSYDLCKSIGACQ